MLQIPTPHFNIYDDVPEDEAVYDSLRTSKSNVGVFQLGQRQAAHLCHLYKQISSLKDISALSSLLRPGMSDVKDDKGRPITECYIARRNGEEEVEYHHPSLEPVLQGTYGFLLFQESALFVARLVAGFDLQKADILRVAIGKKQIDKMKGLRNDFVTGCKATSGIDEEVANKIFDDISASGRYSFNRCISGDEKLFRDKGNYKYTPTIAEMYKFCNDREYAKRTGHSSLGKKYRLFGYGGGFSLSAPNDKAVPNNIVDIRYMGRKTVYLIEIDGGRTIKVTENHKFPTPNGEVTVSQLNPGNRIYAWDGVRYGRTKRNGVGYNIEPYTITSITQVGEDDVYDVEMSDDVSHTFMIENGIVTSNSHAASYAKNAYIDLYFRYYYPEVFYAAQLAYAVEKSASKDKAAELVNGLIIAADEQFGIKVYPPSLEERYLYTTPITNADRKYIRLGFRHVIGFGSADNIQKMFKVVDDITATLGYKSIFYVSWIEILFYYSKKIGKTMMEALIKIGCFAHADGADNRRLQWHEYKQFLKLSEKEVKWITTNILSGNKNPKGVSLQWCIKVMLHANVAVKTRIDTVTVIVDELQNSPSGTSSTWKRLSEKALLYRAFSSPITDEYEGVATAFLDERYGNEERIFVLYIEEVVIGEQKNGLKYARVKCVDEHDNTGTCMVFGREYPLYHQFLQQNEIIQVQGKIKHDEYGATVIASSIK